jgi:hypothetical protein
VDSEEKEKNDENFEIIKQSALELESIVVDLYNSQNFSSAERLCNIILQMYDKIDSQEDVTRIKQIIQKLSLVDQYFDATFGLLKRQIEKDKEFEKEEETEKNQ